MFGVRQAGFQEFSKLGREVQRKILKHLELLRENPFKPRPQADIAPLKGEKTHLYRLRGEEYRMFYAVDGDTIVVLGVGRRKNIYKHL